MGLTLRNIKGSALTHTEMDNNFREFFYSASVSGDTVTFWKSQSLDPGKSFTVSSVFANTGSYYSATSDIKITGSLQVTEPLSGTFTGVHSGSFSGSYEGNGSGVTGVIFSNLASIPSGIVSGAAQIPPLLPAGVISGSVQLDGTVIGETANVKVSGSFSGSFEGDGSGLTGLPSSAVTSYTNAGNNRVITSITTGEINSEANLLFNGSILDITGSLRVLNSISGSEISGSFFGDGSGLTGVGSSGIFAKTGSSYNTTNDLEITGSLNVSLTGSFGRVYGSTISGSFVGDGSGLSGVGGGGIFAQTGSSYNTTNNLEITGSLTTTGDVTVGGTLTELSALRFKTDIVDYTSGLNEVNQVRPVRYIKKDSAREEIGVIAEELDQVLPEFVLRDPTGDPYSVAYPRLTVVLVNAVKELYQIVQTQQEEIDRLKK